MSSTAGLICPNKICKQEIPDDSCFCDQCGIQLLRCEKCGFVSTGKFCGKCAGAMSAIEPPASVTPAAAPASADTSASPAPAVVPVATSASTVIVQLPAETIFLCHPEGWNIEIKNEDILGRTNGPHAGLLGKYPVISSNHAKVTQSNGEWFLTDLNSTNKTFINGTKIEANIPSKLKQNDVVILANVSFTVRLA